MVDLDLGVAGTVLLLVVFALLAAEDALVWLARGEVPGVGFFAASLLVLAVLVVAVRRARANPPPRHP